MKRYCVCGTYIRASIPLCNKCNEKYGPRASWPEWLTFYVDDIKREMDHERNRWDINFNDWMDYEPTQGGTYHGNRNIQPGPPPDE